MEESLDDLGLAVGREDRQRLLAWARARANEAIYLADLIAERP